MKKKIFLYSVLVCLLDQLIKFVMQLNLILNYDFEIINNFFYLTLTHNNGASWNLLNGSRWILIGISIIFLIILLKEIKVFKKNRRNIIAFSLLIGGLLGNLIDRIVHGYVIDYFNFYVFSYNYPIFNVADMAIVGGTILMIISIIRGDDKNEIRS